MILKLELRQLVRAQRARSQFVKVSSKGETKFFDRNSANGEFDRLKRSQFR